MGLLLLLASVYLNGVNIDGVRTQTFEKCRSVRIDEKGDVRLDCPAYQVEGMPGAGAAAPTVPLATSSVVPQRLTKHYWLVTEHSGAAMVDVDVFINSKWVRKLRSTDDQIVLDITRYLAPGSNKILFAATRKTEGGKKASPAAYFKAIVGEGEAGGGNVLIDNPLVECKRTGAETDNVNEEFTVQGR